MRAFLVVISLLVFTSSLVGLLFKGTRGKAKRYAWMSALAMFLALGFFASEQDDEARRMGFVDNGDRRAATEAGVTNPAAWRAAKETKKQAQQAPVVQTPASTAETPRASPGQAAAPVIQDADANQAANGPMPTAHGRAKVCATKDMTFDHYREIKLPAKSVFRDSGPFKGEVRDPSWKSHGSNQRWAAFITTDPVTLTKAKPCAESGVRMLIGKLFKESSASASDRRVWEIDDVLEYSPASARPPVEFGKLIDDISVRAVLLADAGDPLVLAKSEADEAGQSAKCLAESQKVAAHEGGVIGRQTSSVVPISHPAAVEFSFGCGIDGMKPDVFIAWNKSRPGSSTVKLIISAGEFLTGATSEEIKQELAKCVNEALKPDAGEISAREFGGVKIECQAFERDGGGGSATIYRRFGAYPVHDVPGEKVLSEMKRASAALATVEDAEAAKSVEFAKWWLDETIPTKVKTFMMIAARVQALAYRCPTWKPDYTVIAKAAAFADLSVQDIQPGGKYFDTFASMMVGMRKGTEAESRDEACQTAKKNYGEASSN